MVYLHIFFMAPQWIIPWDFTHWENDSHCALGFNDGMMQFLFYFTNAMLMQKSKYAKNENKSCNVEK